MITLLSETQVKRAAKDYRCDACDSIENAIDWLKGRLSFSELRVIAFAKLRRGRILKGDPYTRCAIVNDGDFYMFRAIPGIDKICKKFKLYEQD